jgi:hypothetical protein
MDKHNDAMFNDRGSDVIFSSTSRVTYWGRGEHLMLHIGARVKTLSYRDIGVNTLCYI